METSDLKETQNNPAMPVSMRNETAQEKTWFVLILIGALLLSAAFRLIRLGVIPLNNYEAGYALQALAVADGQPTEFSGQMTYVGLTGLSFYVFKASNFLARFWPAFFGVLIVLVPYMFRTLIGKWPAAIGCVMLAFAPDMVAPSRMVGSPMMALVFVLLTLGFLVQKKPLLVGVCLALGLLSGPGFWMGIVIMGVAFGISTAFFNFKEAFEIGLDFRGESFWKKLGFSFFVTIIVVGTGFFLAPAGLSGVFSGLLEFVTGFGDPRLVNFGIIPFALMAYGAGGLLFGIWGGVRGILVRNKLDIFLFTWAIVGLVLISLYPASQPVDIVWVSLPLWLLSVRVAWIAWRKPESSKLVVGITASFVVFLSAFILLAMRTLITPSLTQAQQVSYLIALVGSVILLTAVILLINYGWSEEIARVGLLLGLAVVISAGMVSVSVNSTGLGPDIPYEMWDVGEAVLYSDWVQVTIDRVMVWNARGRDPVNIHVSGLDTPGLRWALRQYPTTEFVPFLTPQIQPGIVITAADTFPEITNSYQGQGLLWISKVPWNQLSALDYLTWLVSRTVPTIPGELIIWVRTDLMPSGQFID